MSVEVSEKWIGKVAGWKMLKSGRSLWKGRTVKSAEWDAEKSIFTGRVGSGEKPRQVKVVVLGEHDVENKCGCFLARRNGEICEHAVAVMLQAVNGGEELADDWSEAKQSDTLAPSFEPAAFRIELSPKFPDRIEKEVSVRLHQVEGEPTVYDLKFCQWLHQIGLREIPAMLPVSGSSVKDLLVVLDGHGEIVSGEQKISISSKGAMLPVDVEVDEDRVGFKLLGNGADYIGFENMVAIWSEEMKSLALCSLKNTSLLESQLQRMLSGGGLFMPMKQFIRDVTQWERVFDLGASGLLDKVRVIPALPRFMLTIDGSLKRLTVVLTVRYPGGIKVQAGVEGADSDFPIRDGNNEGVWLSREMQAERLAIRKLLSFGFTQTNASAFTLDQEGDVIAFIGGGLAELRKLWTVEEGNQFKSVESNIVRVKPDLKIEGSGEDWLAFDYGYQTDEGKPVPREAIEKMLRAGKRTATTKNGKRIIVSDVDAEMMGEVLRDVDPKQDGGKYYVSLHQAAYIKRVKQFYGKSLETTSVSCLKSLPDSVVHLLREYQREGIAWLYNRLNKEHAALLADDMGLGKTLQTLSAIELIQQDDAKPALVVCPTSLLENWREEVDKFFPEKKAIIVHGSGRDILWKQAQEVDIVITSYGIISRDAELYQNLDFSLLVIDEASVIRNPDTQSAKALRKMKVERRLALTGTPIENALEDLWSIFTFLMPGYLGTREDFKQRYVKPCAGQVPDRGVLQRLRLRAEPFLLRRTKQEVATDLPAKIEQIVWCQPSNEQLQTYAEVHRKGVQEIQDLAKENKGRAKMQMLTVLLRMRQVCCDLRLLGGDDFTVAQASAKLVRLLELIDLAKSGGHRMLVFSQFTSMLSLIKESLDEHKVNYSYLDGATRNRGEVVKQFQKPDGPTVFLISLKAGGMGLNLTAADMVVHFDPWWNPAVEAQATDRAYRIGQTKPVNVYKLVTRDTVEEKILKLQDKKKILIGATVDEEVMMSGLSSEDVDSLLL